jgi:hypothetical protein
VGWLQVWGLSTFLHSLLPCLIALVVYKKPVSLDKRTPTNSVATAQATSTVPFSPAAGGGGGGAGGVDLVARKVGGVLVKLSSDRHLGLAVGINYIIDPLISSLAYRADPAPTACGAGTPPPPPPPSSPAVGGGVPSATSEAGSVQSACGETMAVISRVAERLGEPTVGDAIMPRLLALLSAADRAFPNANAGSRQDKSDKSELPGKGAAASLLSLRADLLGVSGTRGASAAKKHDAQAGQELKDLDSDGHEPLPLFSTSLLANSSAAAGAAVTGARHMDNVGAAGGAGGATPSASAMHRPMSVEEDGAAVLHDAAGTPTGGGGGGGRRGGWWCTGIW